ncbi:TonB-dependent receptor [Temperatibacter marinus]|uniref:TonB-dependent receptor n=1 Tax=Temperatibacter marinus TaxID=1456591 RepID=A0AA52EE70_9PROT|nr:TonB-dependent receptor [Temperatibacter marinus]WND03151.1 TonB-dependent receptor [Temperatibacter marinus]
MKHLKMTSSIAALMTATAFTTPILADDDLILEEIVVTAQKREQSLQDVPVSVSVVNGERMSNLLAGGADIRALASRVPGLNAESSNGRVAPRFYIRGLGNTDFDLAASQPVSVIMDGVVMENVALKSFPLFDVQRVEVLRGPQGTLFGKNTPAGIVKFDTNKPTQDEEGYASFNLGTLGTVELEGAYGGSIDENSSYRVSALYQRRGDWIDNGYTGEENAMGGFTETAARLQFLIEEGPASLHVSVQGRKNKGTSSIFRANIVGGGSNQLNENYDRDTVWFDAGENNPQEYDGLGASATITYDFDTVTLTSITSYNEADGFSLGDIDGGFGASFLPEMGPGFIPFPSATMDRMDKTSQFTQELRFASAADGDVRWQAGAYYFSSDLSVTTFPGFVPESTVQHDNSSWSLFAQVDGDVGESTVITAGARYTDDKKEMVANQVFGTVYETEISDGELSWDIAVNHELNDDVSVYGRLAKGFRAGSIQGRNVAFLDAVPFSVAKPETILSGEVGFKSTLVENRLRLNGAFYKWEMENQQISAVGGTAGNSILLINVPHTNGYGAEFDLEWLVNDNWFVTAGFALTETEIESSVLVGTCAQCTVLDPVKAGGFAQAQGNPLPQAPDWSLNFTARYGVELGEGEFFVFTDWFFEGEKNLFIYESAEYRTSGDLEGNLRVGYTWDDGGYEAAFYVKNITDEDNLKGGVDFNNNTAFVNDARTIGFSFRANF